MEILPEPEFVPTEMEVVPPSDASELSDPLAEEKEEYDDTTFQHDEVGLNPIEDMAVIEKILRDQNRGCCDTAVEDGLVKMNIPEEVIEGILCKADKTLCTCETTAWLENATGYNYCGADDSIAVHDEDSKSADEINLESVAERESIADDAKSTDESKSGSVQKIDDSVASVHDEDTKSTDENILGSSSVTDDTVEVAKSTDESNLDSSLAKDESVVIATTDNAVVTAKITDESDLVEDEGVALATTDVTLATTDDSVEVAKTTDESNLADDEGVALVTTDDAVEGVALAATDGAEEEVLLTEESNFDTALSNDENVSVVSVEAPDVLSEKHDQESGFECVLDSGVVDKENTENQELITYSPSKKSRKLSRLSRKMSSKMSRVVGKLKLRKSLNV